MPKSSQLNVRVSPAVKRKLFRLSRETGKSRSAVLRALVLFAAPDQLLKAWGYGTNLERNLLREIEA